MALDGTLKTLSLPNLIQLHCTQQQRARIRLVQNQREGLLTIANGELIYASVGARTGDEAVYELLAWEDGEFHVSDEVEGLPPRNVQTPWGMLLLDALHRIDEERAERNGAMQALLQESKARQQVRAAIVVGPTGKVRADATDGHAEEDAALTAFIVGRAQSLSRVLNLGTFEQLASTRPSGKVCLERIDDAYLGAWLSERTPLEPFRALLHKLKQDTAGPA